MVRKQYNLEEIDEAYLISTIQNGKQVAEQKAEKVTNKPKAIKTEISSGYLSLFIRQTDSKARFGKHVPIRRNTTKGFRRLCV